MPPRFRIVAKIFLAWPSLESSMSWSCFNPKSVSLDLIPVKGEEEGTNCPDGSFGRHQLLNGPSSTCMSEPLWAYTGLVLLKHSQMILDTVLNIITTAPTHFTSSQVTKLISLIICWKVFFYVCRELGLVTSHIRRTLYTFHLPFSSTSCPFFPTLSSHVWFPEAMCQSAVYWHNDAVCLLWPSLHLNKSTLLIVHNCKSTNIHWC